MNKTLTLMGILGACAIIGPVSGVCIKEKITGNYNGNVQISEEVQIKILKNQNYEPTSEPPVHEAERAKIKYPNPACAVL